MEDQRFGPDDMSSEIRDEPAKHRLPTILPIAWAGVTAVGFIVVILVVSWQLFPRLTAAQSMIEELIQMSICSRNFF